MEVGKEDQVKRWYSEKKWPLVGQQDPCSERHVVGEGQRQGAGVGSGPLEFGFQCRKRFWWQSDPVVKVKEN